MKRKITNWLVGFKAGRVVLHVWATAIDGNFEKHFAGILREF